MEIVVMEIVVMDSGDDGQTPVIDSLRD